MAIKKNPINKEPPSKCIESVQFDLFKNFLSNDKNEVSNTVDIWESIPKYFFTPAKVKTLRNKDGLANSFSWDYTYNGKKCKVKIQPALIEQKSGGEKAFFLGVTEELVEEALKKLLTVQNHGSHDPSNSETWVRFSLSMIQKELKSKGRERNRNEIKQSIEVLSSCVLTLYNEGKEVWKGSILQDLTTVGREEYLSDTNSQHIARLPLFISYSINKLEYRQFNYERLMSCNEQLSRWIYKRIINKYVYASWNNDYHFMFSSLKESGLLQRELDSKNRVKVLSALDELVRKDVLMSYTVHEVKQGRKITDVKYVVQSSPHFISEQKASNKRRSDNEIIAKNAQIPIVDNPIIE